MYASGPQRLKLRPVKIQELCCLDRIVCLGVSSLSLKVFKQNVNEQFEGSVSDLDSNPGSPIETSLVKLCSHAKKVKRNR